MRSDLVAILAVFRGAALMDESEFPGPGFEGVLQTAVPLPMSTWPEEQRCACVGRARKTDPSDTGRDHWCDNGKRPPDFLTFTKAGGWYVGTQVDAASATRIEVL